METLRTFACSNLPGVHTCLLLGLYCRHNVCLPLRLNRTKDTLTAYLVLY